MTIVALHSCSLAIDLAQPRARGPGPIYKTKVRPQLLIVEITGGILVLKLLKTVPTYFSSPFPLSSPFQNSPPPFLFPSCQASPNQLLHSHSQSSSQHYNAGNRRLFVSRENAGKRKELGTWLPNPLNRLLYYFNFCFQLCFHRIHQQLENWTFTLIICSSFSVFTLFDYVLVLLKPCVLGVFGFRFSVFDLRFLIFSIPKVAFWGFSFTATF